MNSKLATVLMAFCLFNFLNGIESSFIKPNNVPRVGRSNEEIFDQGSMGYVIKTNKNIPRMGRRNYDSENRYDIPKFYQLPTEGYKMYDVTVAPPPNYVLSNKKRILEIRRQLAEYSLKLRYYFGSFKASVKQFGRRKVSGSIGDLFLRILPKIYVKISFEKIRELKNRNTTKFPLKFTPRSSSAT